MLNDKFLIINEKILPPVYSKVLLAKKFLAEGVAPNASKAVKMAGISRSAFYKYKDNVFKYEGKKEETVTLSAVLTDKAGVFSAMATLLYELGANIITVNQSSPKDGKAKVTLTANTEKVKTDMDTLLENLKTVKGIISVKIED